MNLEDLKIKVKSTIDLKEFMEKDGLNFKRSTNVTYKALCPFHNEKTPSFVVNENYQNYKCFGCGKSGDIFTYVQEKESISWKESVIFLAKELGLEIEIEENKDYGKYSNSLFILENLASFYITEFDKLEDSHPAKKMITNRGLPYNSNEYGYAPEDKNKTLSFLKNLKIKDEDLIELGILSKNGYLQQTNRLVFIIRNYMGKVIGFSGRALTQKDEENRKYVNSSDSIVYHKKNTAYNISKAKNKASQDKEIYLVEGQFDVSAMNNRGYTNTVAISGTAFTKEILNLIEKPIGTTGKIILVLDNDTSGLKAAHKIFTENPSVHQRLYIITLEKGMDPCDYLKVNEKLKEPVLYMEYMFQKIKETSMINNTQNKLEYLNRVQEHLTQFISNKAIKEQYLRRACVYSDFDYNNIEIINTQKEKENFLEQHQEDTTATGFFITAIAHLLSIIKEENVATEFIYIKDVLPKSIMTVFRACLKDSKNFKIEDEKLIALYNKIIEVEIEELDLEDTKHHIKNLIKTGLELYEKNQKHKKMSNIMKNIETMTSNEEIKSFILNV